MKHGRLIKTLAMLSVFTALSASLAACGDSSNKDEHVLTGHDAVPSTCTQEGTIEYWDCSHCDKLFADAEGKQEITDIIEQKKPHSIDDKDYHAAVPSKCEEDGTLAYYECESCHGKFANKDGTKELADIVDPAAHTPASHSKVEPTFTTPGKKQHWECGVCGKFFLTEDATEPVEESALVIDALGEETVAVNVTVKDKTGAIVDDSSAVKVKLVLQNAPFDYTYGGDDGVGITADGKLDLDKIGAGTYKVTDAQGYYDTTLTIAEGTATVELVLEEIEHIAHNPNTDNPEYLTFESVNGEHRMVFNAPWDKTKESTAVYVDVQDDAISGENYMADFTVRAAYKDTGWTSRFYVAAADGTGSARIGYGFIFGNEADKLIMDDMTGEYKFGNVLNEYKLNGQGGHYDSAAMVDALQTEQGLKLRVIRNGRTITFYTATTTGWDEFRTLTLAGDYGARLAFAVTANETITFSNVSVASYVAPVYKTDTVVLGHYVKGDKVYTVTGEETTLAALEISKLEHFALTLKAGETPIAKDTGVKLSNAALGDEIEATVGENGAVTLDGKVYDSLDYTLVVDGYVWQYTFTVDGAEVVFDGISDSYTQKTQVELDKSHEYEGVDTGSSLEGTTDEQIVLKTNGWATADQAVLKTTDALKNAEVFTLMFTYQINKFETWPGNRYGIRVSDTQNKNEICGFFLYPREDGQKVQVGYLYGDINFNRLSDNNPTDEFIDLTALTQPMLLAGAQFKVEYRFGHATLYVMAEESWEKLYEVNTVGNPQIAFAAGNHVNTYTDISIVITEVEKLDTVALTLKDQNGAVIAKDTAVTLTSEKKTIETTVGDSGVVTLTGETAVYNYVDYVVTVDGSTTDLTVWFSGATAELEGFVMPQLIDSVALTLKAGDTPVATGKKVKLTSALGTVEATVGENGVVTLADTNKVYDRITYSVKVEGYAFAYDIVFDGATAEITEFEATVNWEYSDPSKTSVVTGSGNWATQGSFTNNSTADKIAFDATFPTSKEVVVDTGDTLANAPSYTLYFTVKATSVTGWAQRIGIRIAAGTENQTVGFFLYHKDNGEIHVGPLWGKIDFNDQGNNGLTVKSDLNISMFANGLDMKAERKQNSATLYAKLDGTWTPINTVTLSGGSGALGFSASAGSFEYTNVALYVKPLENKTLSLTLSDGDGNALAEGTSISLTDPRGTTVSKTTDAQGNITLETPYLGDYLVEVNGTVFIVNFSADSLTASKTIGTAWTYTKADDATEWKAAGSVDNLTVTKTDTSVTVASAWDNNSWKRGGVNLNIGNNLDSSTNYTIRFKLTATLTGGWTERFGIRLISGTGNDDNVGFLIWSKDDSLNFTTLDGNVDIGSREPKDNTIITNEAVKDGLDIQIVRNGNSATMYAKIDGAWKEVYTVTLSEGQTPQLGFYAAGGTYTYSDMSIVTVTDTAA